MNLLDEAQALWPSASLEAIDALMWITPYPFVSGDKVVASLTAMRTKWGPNIQDAISGEMAEFDAAFAEHKRNNPGELS
jgi:hypothetical protein